MGNIKVVNIRQREEDVGKVMQKGFEPREVHQNLVVVTKVGFEVRNIFCKESQNFTESYGQGTNQMTSRQLVLVSEN